MKKYRNKRGYKKKRSEKKSRGLCVDVYNNNVDGALKVLKKKVKESKLFLELRKKEYYQKPSDVKREKRALGRLRNQRRQMEAENKSGNFRK
tara:strand:- start:360 stop:635 length:276 start_codon:yes stop_codon:yes gene_type:complete